MEGVREINRNITLRQKRKIRFSKKKEELKTPSGKIEREVQIDRKETKEIVKLLEQIREDIKDIKTMQQIITKN